MLRALFNSGKPGEPGVQSTERVCGPSGGTVPGTPKAMLTILCFSSDRVVRVSCGDNRADRDFVELDVFPKRHQQFPGERHDADPP